MTDSLWSFVTAPWALRPDTLLGATLLVILAALLGEVFWRRLGWPRLMGYCTVGAVLAVTGMNADFGGEGLRLVVDVALALLLFEAGVRLNLRWLGRNPWLLATSVAEAALSAIAVYLVARMLGVDPRTAAVLGLIAMSVSPAVVQRVVMECDAAGQVTERLLALTALNTLYAVLALKALSVGVQLGDPASWQLALPSVLVTFFGSILLGGALGWVVAVIARRLDLRNENSVVLVLSFVLLALVVAKTLQLSTLLVPLLAGLWLRNRTQRPWVWPRHFGTAGGALVLVLFVAVSSSWSIESLPSVIGVCAAIVAVRWLVKGAVVLAFARPSGLGLHQASCLALGMLPMSATAWVMALEFSSVHAARGVLLMPLVLGSLALVELAAPLLLMYGLRRAGELDVNQEKKAGSK
jgi:Kef-type K+ transport system membrane component KefB